MTSSHYLKQYWRVINRVLWHLPKGKKTGNVHESNHDNTWNITHLKSEPHPSGDNELNFAQVMTTPLSCYVQRLSQFSTIYFWLLRINFEIRRYPKLIVCEATLYWSLFFLDPILFIFDISLLIHYENRYRALKALEWAIIDTSKSLVFSCPVGVVLLRSGHGVSQAFHTIEFPM